MKVIDFKGESQSACVESMKRFIGEGGTVPIKSEALSEGVRLWYRDVEDAEVHSGAMRSPFA